MTDLRSPQAGGVFSVRRSPDPVSLAGVTVDLTCVARFPSALLIRRIFLPIGMAEGALEVLAPRGLSRAVEDEIAFVAGCPVVLRQAADGNLPRFIAEATAAHTRGMRLFRPEDRAAEALASSLSYIEDLNAGAESLSFGGDVGLAGGGPSLLDDGIQLGEALASSLAELNAGGFGQAVTGKGAGPSRAGAGPRVTASAVAGQMAVPDLPPVVDLEPAWEPSTPPGLVTPHGASLEMSPASRGPSSARTPAPPASPALRSSSPAFSPPPVPGGSRVSPSESEDELVDDPDALALGHVAMDGPGDLLDDEALLDDSSHLDEDGLLDVEKPRALVAGASAPGGRPLVDALRRHGFAVSATDLGGEALAAVEPQGAVVLAWSLSESTTGLLEGLRRLRRGDRPWMGELVALVVTPPELAGWRTEGDLQTAYGVDVVLSPGWDDALLGGRLSEALVRRTGRQMPMGSSPKRGEAEELSRRATSLYRKGRLQDAVECFHAAIARDGRLASAHVGLALAHAKENRPLAAILAFERATALDPTQVAVLRSLAILYEKRGFLLRALDTWHRVLGASSDEVQCKEILAKIDTFKVHRTK